MNVFIVEFQHRNGSEFWCVKSSSLADLLIDTVQEHIFKARGEPDWTFEEAQENWAA